MPNDYVEGQVLTAFVTGVFWGILKECKEAGIVGTVAAHMTINSIAMLTLLYGLC